MASLRTFIEALKTGETRTTKALDQVVGRRRGAAGEARIAALGARGAFNAPLQPALRQALRDARLPERNIQTCIDDWPDAQKERARRAMVAAIAAGRRVRFRWGLTDAAGFELEISEGNTGPLTITARSPRGSLRVQRDEVYAAPAAPPKRTSVRPRR